MNIAGAVIALAGYVIVPIPFLRLLLVTHLTVAAFSLIAAQTLDGSRLRDRRPWVGAVLALIIAVGAGAISAGAV